MSNGFTLRNVLRRNCGAYNSQVCFESTEDGEVETIACIANVDAVDVWDGGTLIPCETMFHEYGAIKRVRRLRCRGYSQAGAGAHPIPTTADILTVIYEACDIEVTNAVPAL